MNKDILDKNQELNTLIGVLLNNSIYYIPSEIIFEDVLESLEGEIEDQFFDDLSFIDISKGFYSFSNIDKLEVNQKLITKRQELEQNIFKLIAKNKSIDSLTFQHLISKYTDQVLFFIYISKWLASNLKKYNENIDLTLFGAFNIQFQIFSNHLNELVVNFDSFIKMDNSKEFTTEFLASHYFPELASRMSQIMKDDTNDDPSLESKEKTALKQQTPLKKKTIKKIRPQIDEETVENLLLESVFKVELESN